jgi:hypothetical protein
LSAIAACRAQKKNSHDCFFCDHHPPIIRVDSHTA